MRQLLPNWKYLASVVGYVAIVCWAITLLCMGTMSFGQLWKALGTLTVATAFVGGTAYYYHAVAWKWWLCRKLSGIPDFSGRWEGWQRRPDGQWVPTTHEITQKGLDITVRAWGLKNISEGTSVSILTDQHNVAATLIWSYAAEPITPPVNVGDSHAGTHFLRLTADGKKMTGKYVNDRRRDDGSYGAVGHIEIMRVQKSMQGELAFDQETWGMQKPESAVQ